MKPLFCHPFCFSFGQRLAQFGETLHRHIFFLFQRDNVMLRTKGLESLIGLFHLSL